MQSWTCRFSLMMMAKYDVLDGEFHLFRYAVRTVRPIKDAIEDCIQGVAMPIIACSTATP